VNDPSGSGAGRRAGRSPQSRTSALLGVLERRSRLAGDVRAVVDARGEGLTYGQWYEGALRTVRASQREASEGASVILLGERDDLLMPPVFVGSVASGRLTGLVSLRLSRSRIQAAISELGATVAFASERTISSLGWLGADGARLRPIRLRGLLLRNDWLTAADTLQRPRGRMVVFGLQNPGGAAVPHPLRV
jgi:hypothetical protein